MDRVCGNCTSGYRQNDAWRTEPGPLWCLGARAIPPAHWRQGREYQKGDPPMLHLIIDEAQAGECAAFEHVSVQEQPEKDSI